MTKKQPEHEGWPVGEHARGGRGGSKSNDSRGGQRGNNGPRMKQAVTMAEVKKRAEERDNK